MQTCVAVASASPAARALIRLGGPSAQAVATAAGLTVPSTWQHSEHVWALGAGLTPCRVLFCAGPRSFTGEDLVEILLPGQPDLLRLALNRLLAAGAEAAPAGWFARRAFANGRLDLPAARAILDLAQAGDAEAAADALRRLRGGLSATLHAVRARCLDLRAGLEASLDFADEDDVVAVDTDRLAKACRELAAQLGAWQRGASAVSQAPLVAVVGAPNAGKSALANRLGQGQALVSPEAGTTRDLVESSWHCGGRVLRLIDSAGLRQAEAGSIEAQAIAAQAELLRSADLVLLCSAPDAPLPIAELAALQLDPQRCIHLATKADLGPPKADLGPLSAADTDFLQVSAHSGQGLEALHALVTRRLAASGSDDQHEQDLARAVTLLRQRSTTAAADPVLAAADLREASDLLAGLLGEIGIEDVLDEVFSRFCIGK